MKYFNSGRTPWVTASEVATVEICPYQLYLKESGKSVSKDSKKRARRGNNAHDEFNISHKSFKESALRRAIKLILFILWALFIGYSIWQVIK